MDIINSAWFLGMLKKAGATPRERLLALFDILDDWVNAPHIREKFSSVENNPGQPQALLEYLTAQATASGAQEPEVLAQQIYFMAVSMLQEELRSPGCAASQHAKQVAQALIQAQTERGRFISKRSAYAMAASVFFVTGIASVLIYGMLIFGAASPLGNKPNTPSRLVAIPAASNAKFVEASPEQTAALFATIEQMRKGECQYPEALQLPDSQKGVYLTNVVGGQISSNAADQAVVEQLLKKVRCNYTPMLMKNSVG
jgi:hypothetical protein